MTTLELIRSYDLRHAPAEDLMGEASYKLTELANLRASDEIKTPYRDYLVKCLAALSGELIRRRALVKYGAPKIAERGRYSPALIEDIKRRIPLSQLMGYDIDVDPRPTADRRYKAHCPVHGDGRDRDASMTIYENEGRYWCFGCNAGGDHMDWLASYHHMSFTEAVEYLANMAGLDLSVDVPKPTHKIWRPEDGIAAREI